jgi:hypothetical protein
MLIKIIKVIYLLLIAAPGQLELLETIIGGVFVLTGLFCALLPCVLGGLRDVEDVDVDVLVLDLLQVLGHVARNVLEVNRLRLRIHFIVIL